MAALPGQADLLKLLLSQDLAPDAVAEIEAIIKDNLQTYREVLLLNDLVDSYMYTSSKRCMQILATVQEPHDKHLMDRIVEHIKGASGTRLQALTLFAYIVRKQPAWLYQVARHSLMATITKTLKTDNDVPVLMCGVLILASLTPIIPVAIISHLHDIFEVFSRLVAFNLRKPGNVPDEYLLHLQVGVYALFHRLYGMYPCNFLTYLRATYSKPENSAVFHDLIKPMLERVRMHPLLVTASKDKELATERWVNKEVHDIIVECAKMSLDPIEGWSEDSLGPVFRHSLNTPATADKGRGPRGQAQDVRRVLQPVEEAAVGAECAAVIPVGDECAAVIPAGLLAQDPLWSPSSVCGLSTPPPLTPNVTPSVTDMPGGPLTPLQCMTSHVDSPLPHDETESLAACLQSPAHDSQSEADTQRRLSTSSSVPSVSELPQFIDSLDVVPASRDKLEAEDQEVCELTQEVLDDDSVSGGSDSGLPSHIPSSVPMTAQSVATFMKQVNRIRFNTMTVAQCEKRPQEKQHSRSSSCPNLKDQVGDPGASPAHALSTVGVGSDVTDDDTHMAGADVEALSSDVVMTHVTKVTTTIQTQTSVVSTSSVGSEGGGAGVARVGASSQKQHLEAPSQPETEAERFYRYLMGILLPAPSFCEHCGAVSDATDTTPPASQAPEAGPATQPAVQERKLNLLAGRPSPGGVPIYTTMSPPEMLDRHILLGETVHASLPLTARANVSWTHFGGAPPADEVTILSNQLLLLHTQLMFERHKSELHAKRNRRLLGRTVKTAALEEQYSAMQDQLRLQENEIQILSESLRLQQQVAAELRASNDRHACDRQVLHKSHTEELERLRSGREVLQSELTAQKEEDDRLSKELQRVRAHTFCLQQELSFIQNKVGRTDELQTEVTRLTKELFLMGELQQKYQQRLVAVTNSHNSKPETHFVLNAYKAEVSAVRLCLDQKNTLLDMVRARLTEAEDFLKHKDLVLAEDKKLMDHLRAQHRGELQALDEKYRAQKKIQLGLHAQILALYGQVPAPPQPAAPQPAAPQPAPTPPPHEDTVSDAVTGEPPEQGALSAGRHRSSLSPGGSAGTPAGGATSPSPITTPGGNTSPTDVSPPERTSADAGCVKQFAPHGGSAFKSYQEQTQAEPVSEPNS